MYLFLDIIFIGVVISDFVWRIIVKETCWKFRLWFSGFEFHWRYYFSFWKSGCDKSLFDSWDLYAGKKSRGTMNTSSVPILSAPYSILSCPKTIVHFPKLSCYFNKLFIFFSNLPSLEISPKTKPPKNWND